MIHAGPSKPVCKLSLAIGWLSARISTNIVKWEYRAEKKLLIERRNTEL